MYSILRGKVSEFLRSPGVAAIEICANQVVVEGNKENCFCQHFRIFRAQCPS
jgi:hypothetical protein